MQLPADDEVSPDEEDTERSPLKPTSEVGSGVQMTTQQARADWSASPSRSPKPTGRRNCIRGAASDSDRVVDSGGSEDDSGGSAATPGDSDDAASGTASPNVPAVPKAKRRLGLNAGGAILKRVGWRGSGFRRDGGADIGAEELAAAGDAEAAGAEGDGSTAAPESAQRAAQRELEQAAARLAVGLTERVRPQFTPPAEQVKVEAALYVLPRVGLFKWLSSRLDSEADAVRSTQPMTELYDGLYVEEMPPSSTRSLQVYRGHTRIPTQCFFLPVSPRIQLLVFGMVA